MESKPVKYCPLCGEQLEFYYAHDYDHMGPLASGTWKPYEHKCAAPLKRMCLNCAHFESDECVNDQVLNDINVNIEPFEVVSIKVKLKCVTSCCKHWKIRESIAKRLFM